MDKNTFKAVIESLGVISGELTDLPLEDFIRQINFMVKDGKFTDEYHEHKMLQLLMLSQGLLTIKSVVLMSQFNAFD